MLKSKYQRDELVLFEPINDIILNSSSQRWALLFFVVLHFISRAFSRQVCLLPDAKICVVGRDLEARVGNEHRQILEQRLQHIFVATHCFFILLFYGLNVKTAWDSLMHTVSEGDSNGLFVGF